MLWPRRRDQAAHERTPAFVVLVPPHRLMGRVVEVDTTGAAPTTIAGVGVCSSVSITGGSSYWAGGHTRWTTHVGPTGLIKQAERAARQRTRQRMRRMCTLWTRPNIAKYAIKPDPP